MTATGTHVRPDPCGTRTSAAGTGASGFVLRPRAAPTRCTSGTGAAGFVLRPGASPTRSGGGDPVFPAAEPTGDPADGRLADAPVGAAR